MRFWERQDGETVKAYHAFQLYRDAGPERSGTRVAAQLGKSKKLIERWRSQHDWVARAQAYDDFLEVKIRAELERRDLERKADLAERNRKVDEGYIEIREKMLEKAREMWGWPLERTEEVEEYYEDGRPKIIKIVKPARWSFNTGVNLSGQLDPSPDKLAFTNPTGEQPYGMSDEQLEAEFEQYIIRRFTEHEQEEKGDSYE